MKGSAVCFDVPAVPLDDLELGIFYHYEVVTEEGAGGCAL